MHENPSIVPFPRRRPAEAAVLTRLEGEHEEDRLLRRTLAIAATAHLLLLAVHLPSGGEPLRIEPTHPPRYHQIPPTPRIKRAPPPEIDTTPPIRPREVTMPVPGPVPTDPEPIRDVAAEELPPLDLEPVSLWTVPDAPPAPPAADPVPFGAGMERPVALYAPPPVYTEAARHRRVQGMAVVEAVIEADGRVTSVRIVKDLPMGLGGAAARAVAQWRFEPATRNGRPIAVFYRLSVHFAIQ